MDNQYDPVDEYGRGFDAGYTAAMIAYRKPLPAPDAIASMGKNYTHGFSAGVAQYHADKTREVRE